MKMDTTDERCIEIDDELDIIRDLIKQKESYNIIEESSELEKLMIPIQDQLALLTDEELYSLSENKLLELNKDINLKLEEIETITQREVLDKSTIKITNYLIDKLYSINLILESFTHNLSEIEENNTPRAKLSNLPDITNNNTTLPIFMNKLSLSDIPGLITHSDYSLNTPTSLDILTPFDQEESLVEDSSRKNRFFRDSNVDPFNSDNTLSSFFDFDKEIGDALNTLSNLSNKDDDELTPKPKCKQLPEETNSMLNN
jgi:hypothetical protein